MAQAFQLGLQKEVGEEKAECSSWREETVLFNPNCHGRTPPFSSLL